MKRAVIVICIVVVLVALGVGAYALVGNQKSHTSSTASHPTSTAHTSSPSSTSSSSSSPSKSSSGSTSSGTSMCTSSDIQVSLDRSAGGGAAGSTYYSVVFTNTSKASCTTAGYPGVSMVDDSGNQIGKSASRDTSQAVQSITLAPGERATANVRVVDNNYPAGTCAAGATQFKIYPPNDTSYLFLHIGSLTWCPGFSVAPLQKS